jgi:hypothetical protein
MEAAISLGVPVNRLGHAQRLREVADRAHHIERQCRAAPGGRHDRLVRDVRLHPSPVLGRVPQNSVKTTESARSVRP